MLVAPLLSQAAKAKAFVLAVASDQQLGACLWSQVDQLQLRQEIKHRI